MRLLRLLAEGRVVQDTEQSVELRKMLNKMKGRKALHLHFTWGELWVQDLVLEWVGLDSLLHSQQLETTFSQALATNNINLVGSKSKILRFYTLPITFSLILYVGITKLVKLFGMAFCSYIFLPIL